MGPFTLAPVLNIRNSERLWEAFRLGDLHRLCLPDRPLGTPHGRQ